MAACKYKYDMVQIPYALDMYYIIQTSEQLYKLNVTISIL